MYFTLDTRDPNHIADQGPNRADIVAAGADAEGLTVAGIVSADVVIPNQKDLRALERSDLVYLVDLSIADYMRQNPGISDVSQNDVYWIVAGWE